MLPILILAVGMASCKKDKAQPNVTPIEKDLKASFGYKVGSYWIYKDSVSGTTDSAYVTNVHLDTFYPGCVIFKDESKLEGMYITVAVNNSVAGDGERWNFFMKDSTFSVSMFNSRDSVENQLNLTLFKYPFVTGATGSQSGCVLYFDNGTVADIIPVVSLNGESYQNSARSAHTLSPGGSGGYNDCFYVNASAGIVKLVFDHPSVAVHRVLELQRYHLVR